MRKNIITNIIYVLFICTILVFIFINKYFKYLNSFVWSIAIIMMFSSGIYFTFKYKFLQFKIKDMFKTLFSKDNFSSLALTLGAKIGVGSLSGIALAIYYGGPGTIFWMWITSLVTSINTYVETILSIKYQEKKDNLYITTPAYYIKKGLKDNKLAILYSVLVLLAYIGGFIPIQTNTIIKSITGIFNINTYFIIFIICLLTYFVIFKEAKRITNFSAKIVPLMTIIYLLIGVFIIIKNITIIPKLIIMIFSSAFNFKSGIVGIFTTFIIGIQRGIFATEAGIGSSAINSNENRVDSHNQGLCQMFGIHLTSFIICTLTAFIILTSNYSSLNLIDTNGIEITAFAFNYNLGNYGSILLMIVTILFAYSTIISGYYFGELSLNFIFNKLPNYISTSFKILTFLLIILGGILKSTTIWLIVDVFIAFLAITNIYAINKLVDNNR